MIGIIGAMAIEIETLRERMEDCTVQETAGISFFRGKLHGVDCAAAYSSPGKVNAAACTQIMISQYQPSAVINTGVAGGIGDGIHVGDLVVSSAVVQHDIDTTAVGDEIGLISGINRVQIPADDALTEAIIQAAPAVYDGRIHSGIIATGDQFIADSQKLRWISDTFGALACEMESGSIGQVCFLNGIPFAAIRAISDNGNEDAGMTYAQFAEIAAHKSAELLYRIFPDLAAR